MIMNNKLKGDLYESFILDHLIDEKNMIMFGYGETFQKYI